MRNLALTVVLLAMMLLGGGVAYGLNSVSWSHARSCGNGFAYSADPARMTVDEQNACKREQSPRQAVTWGLVIAGLVGLIAGTTVIAVENKLDGHAPARAKGTSTRCAG